MRASRLLSILVLLQLRARLTAEALAAEFEVSVRTIYRDIEELGAAGIPVYGDRGPGGGFQLLDGWQTRLTGLARDEAEALFMIGMPGPAAALGLGSAAAAARNKLLAALPQAWTGGALRIAARFHLDPVDWYRAAEAAGHLPRVARAVLDERRIRFSYESWRGQRLRVVEPLGLVLKAGAWYLVAGSGASVRTYKVANIRKLAVLGATQAFVRPAGFDLAVHWAESLRQFEAALRPEVAVLRASPQGRVRLARLGAWAAAAVKAASPLRGARGLMRVRLPIENVEDAALLLLGIGPQVEVEAPRALRERLAQLAAEIVRKAGPRAHTRRTRAGAYGSR